MERIRTAREGLLRLVCLGLNNLWLPVWAYNVLQGLEFVQLCALLLSSRFSFMWRESVPGGFCKFFEYVSLLQVYQDSQVAAYAMLYLQLGLGGLLGGVSYLLLSRQEDSRNACYFVLIKLASLLSVLYKTVLLVPCMGVCLFLLA
jgi:hypothetical protein